MAENHPVGFRWVIKARERGAHGHPRRSAVHANLGDGRHVGAASRRQRHRLSRRAGQPRPHARPASSATTSSPTRTPRRSSRGLPRHRGSRRVFLGLGCRRQDDEYSTGSPGPTTTAGRARSDAAASALRVPACSKRHFARYTPAMVEEVCGVPRGVVRARRRRYCRASGPDGRRHLLRRRAGRSTRPACRSSARRRSCSSCSATSAGPAAGSWRCAATRRSRDRPTSRRSTTSCPAICRCRSSATDSPTLGRLHRADTTPAGLVGQLRQVHLSPAEGVVRRRRRPRRTSSASAGCRASAAITRISATGSRWPTARGEHRDGLCS